MCDVPLVSVVVPTYERSAMLVEAVESVFRQTYGNVELLVVDDASELPAEQALAEVTPPADTDLRVLRHEENRGANAARNTGIEAARGEFVAFLDDDDYWRPGKLARQVSALRGADEAVGVAFTGLVYVDENGTTTATTSPVTDGDFLEQLVRGATFGTFSAVMARADVFDSAGLTDERFPCWQDREWYFSVAADYDYVSIPEPLTVRRYHDDRQISDDYEARRDVAYPLLVQKHRDRIAAVDPGYERTFLATLNRYVGLAALRSQRYFDGVRYLLRALRYDPTAAATYLYLLVAVGGRYTYEPARVCRRLFERVSHYVSTVRARPT
ncbi:hypothetical protein BV210_03630 [Halorientalis sp. IM1011]|uniref:glycosyltransferase family 2 protein n=1 Tax=Halorientalis sp. IM1011 TaxID=1932360 RepID=UPI00097CC5E9|nr:glycosyltransferase family 2 protein [Halorientalis sp. IM1011]AQL41862.1 hypothetical protein BV210_03630 [Halorientalis sp. IM1011]